MGLGTELAILRGLRGVDRVWLLSEKEEGFGIRQVWVQVPEPHLPAQ